MSFTSPLKLFTPVQLDKLVLRNRMALAPLTRARASEDHVPTDVMSEHYAQRASAGLVITEATGISRQGLGWEYAPGIWSDAQVAGWAKVTEAVHAKGGVVCVQLWHMGRQAHSSITGEAVVSASAIQLDGEVTAAKQTKQPFEVPEVLTEAGIDQIVEDYRKAAENAKKAGMDAVEVHSANGYLLDQFLQPCSNTRTDAYGGSIENRARFLLRVLDAVCGVYPPHRVGVRVAPNGSFGGMGSADNLETFSEVVRLLGERQLGYVHLVDGLAFGFHEKCEAFTLRRARDILAKTAGREGTLLVGNCGYTKETAEERLQADEADLIAFGRLWLSNPDLPERFALGAELNEDCPHELWFTQGLGRKGYTDYPTLGEGEAAAGAQS